MNEEALDLTEYFYKDVSMFIIDAGLIRYKFTQILNAENDVTNEKKEIRQTVYGVIMTSVISCIQIETLEDDDGKDTYLIFGSPEGYLKIPCKDYNGGLLVLKKISEICQKSNLLPYLN